MDWLPVGVVMILESLRTIIPRLQVHGMEKKDNEDLEKGQSPFMKHWLNWESSTLRYREPEVCVAAEWTHHDVFLAFTGFVSCFLMWVGDDSLFCLNLFTRVWTLRAWTSLLCTSSHWNMKNLLNWTIQILKKPSGVFLELWLIFSRPSPSGAQARGLAALAESLCCTDKTLTQN